MRKPTISSGYMALIYIFSIFLLAYDGIFSLFVCLYASCVQIRIMCRAMSDFSQWLRLGFNQVYRGVCAAYHRSAKILTVLFSFSF